MTRLQRRLIYLFIVLLIASLAVGTKVVFFPSTEKPKFITTTVAPTDMVETVLADGTLEAFLQVNVGAQVSGQIKSLPVVLGQVVKKGDLVAEIDSRTQQDSVRDAEAALAKVRADKEAKLAALKQAELAFARQKTMLKRDAISRESYETAQANLDTIRADISSLDAQIQQAEIAVSKAKTNLEYTTIVAPIDGTVVAIIYQEGQTVNSAQQAPTIIKLAQLDTMTIKAQISEADVPRVRPDQKVYFTILGEPDNRYYAKLRSIEPAPDSIQTESASSSSSSSSSNSGSSTAIYYNGLFDVPNPDGKLRISMTAQVVVVLNEAKGILTIPRSALSNEAKNGAYTVRVLEGSDRIVDRNVKTGMTDGVSVEVTEGLKEGEQVIVGEATGNTSTQIPRRMRPPPMGL